MLIVVFSEHKRCTVGSCIYICTCNGWIHNITYNVYMYIHVNFLNSY